MLHHGAALYKLTSAAGWVVGAGIASVGIGAEAVHASGAAPINATDFYTRLGLIVAGFGLIGAKALDFYQRKRTIDSESYIGRYEACKERLDAAAKEYEHRIANKLQQLEYLQRDIDRLHAMDDQKTATLVRLTETLLAVQDSMATLVRRTHDLADRSFDASQDTAAVTRAALDRIAAHPVDVHVTNAPGDPVPTVADGPGA